MTIPAHNVIRVTIDDHLQYYSDGPKVLNTRKYGLLKIIGFNRWNANWIVEKKDGSRDEIQPLDKEFENYNLVGGGAIQIPRITYIKYPKENSKGNGTFEKEKSQAGKRFNQTIKFMNRVIQNGDSRSQNLSRASSGGSSLISPPLKRKKTQN